MNVRRAGVRERGRWERGHGSELTLGEEQFKERMLAAEHGAGEITKQQIIVLVDETRHSICHLQQNESETLE